MALGQTPQTTGAIWWIIGSVKNKMSGQIEKFETGWAIDHISGRLTNESLLKMTDDQLKELAISKDGKTVYEEAYKNTDDAVWCKKNDSTPGQTYYGRHRAWEILRYRVAAK